MRAVIVTSRATIWFPLLSYIHVEMPDPGCNSFGQFAAQVAVISVPSSCTTVILELSTARAVMSIVPELSFSLRSGFFDCQNAGVVGSLPEPGAIETAVSMEET